MIKILLQIEVLCSGARVHFAGELKWSIHFPKFCQSSRAFPDIPGRSTHVQKSPVKQCRIPSTQAQSTFMNVWHGLWFQGSLYSYQNLSHSRKSAKKSGAMITERYFQDGQHVGGTFPSIALQPATQRASSKKVHLTVATATEMLHCLYMGPKFLANGWQTLTCMPHLTCLVRGVNQ